MNYKISYHFKVLTGLDQYHRKICPGPKINYHCCLYGRSLVRVIETIWSLVFDEPKSIVWSRPILIDAFQKGLKILTKFIRR